MLCICVFIGNTRIELSYTFIIYWNFKRFLFMIEYEVLGIYSVY